MKDLIKIELQKIIKRKDSLLMATMIFIPILYSVGLAMESKAITYVGTGQVYGLSFAAEMYIFAYMCFVYFIILSVCSVRSLKGEIENKSIQLYIQRVNDRGKIYMAKNISYFILILINAIIFMVVSIICFYLFLVQRKDIAVPVLLMEGETLSCLVRIVVIMICFIFTVCVSMFLGAYLKSYAAMGVFIFIWVAFMYLKEFSYVKYVIPIYYVEKIVNEDIGVADGRSFGILILLVAFYSTISVIFGKRKFEKSDL